MEAGGLSLSGSDLRARPSELGRWAVFAGYPLGVGVIGGVLLLILGERAVGAGSEWFSDGFTPVYVFTALLVPFSVAGGTLEGLYGRRVGGLPCCTLVILGAAVGYALPLGVARYAGLYSFEPGLVAAVTVGIAVQIAAAVAGWALIRRSVEL